MAKSDPFLYTRLEDDENGQQSGIPLEDQYHDDPNLLSIHNDANPQSYTPHPHSSFWRNISNRLLSRANWETYTRQPTVYDLKQALIQALPRLYRPASLRIESAPGPTAYLDALRGYAAWNVFLAHGYKDYHFWYNHQPFLSALMAGEAMVSLFFVISGYVLSYRLLVYSRTRSSEKVLLGLASSTFRRGMRLYGSTTVALFAALILVRLGLYNGGKWPVYIESLSSQLYDWFWTLVYFCNPFANTIYGYYTEGGLQNKYLGPMWTIPVELRGSMVIFIYIAATCKLHVYTRVALTCLLIIVCYIWIALYIAEFFMGMLVAEIALLCYPERLAAAVSLPEHGTKLQQQNVTSKCFWTLVFIVGLFLLGQPDSDTNALGIFGDWPWAFLRSWLPGYLGFGDRTYWYLGIGSFFLVLGLEMYPTLQAPLRYGWSQYVGELSFGIYALHVPLLVAIIGHWYEVDVRQAYGWDKGWGVLPGALIMHVAVFTCADYFNRIDKRIVRLGRWVQEQCFEQWDKT
ncbi:hypothetical protein LTR84_011403 [Exophiala bonariae]|uniref:Acyltransferase 3 domain-containing protein n=1 Tax=Exophiala bonariae TaxID=1690606 RepID=A0AAV9MUM7_9EURO|nr:hypothetical protein LTR84_011403 [Exophiala bonariae]